METKQAYLFFFSIIVDKFLTCTTFEIIESNIHVSETIE